MPDGAGRFTQGFTGPALLRIPPGRFCLRVQDCHLLRSGFPTPFRSAPASRMAVLQPRSRRIGPGLGSSPFARHYLGNHDCFLFLPLLRCFSSERLPPDRSRSPRSRSHRGVAPFGHPRIPAFLQLPAAYRSFTRPSSPVGAKASTVCRNFAFMIRPDQQDLVLRPLARLLYVVTSICQRTSPSPRLRYRTSSSAPSAGG